MPLLEDESPAVREFAEWCISEFRSRLEHKFIPEPNTGCWLWLDHIDANGYGKISFRGRPAMAHRVVYEFYRGPIPRGLCLDHLCRCRCCVNPDHLEAVTLGENTRRGHVGEINRTRLLALTRCKFGHPLSGENLYVVERTGQRVCRACKLQHKRNYNGRLPKKITNRAKTHCPKGHPYSGGNLYVYKNTGARKCQACHRARESLRKIMSPRSSQENK